MFDHRRPSVPARKTGLSRNPVYRGRFVCMGIAKGTPWTAVAAADIVSTP